MVYYDTTDVVVDRDDLSDNPHDHRPMVPRMTTEADHEALIRKALVESVSLRIDRQVPPRGGLRKNGGPPGRKRAAPCGVDFRARNVIFKAHGNS